MTAAMLLHELLLTPLLVAYPYRNTPYTIRASL